MLKKQFVIFGVAMTVIAIAILFAVLNQSKNKITDDEIKPIIIENQTDLKIVNASIPERDTKQPITEKQINDTLNQIEQKNNDNSYTPPPREWITSGPLQIDRTKYILGEKVFMRFGGISPSEKGQIAFLRPLNDTHYSLYLSIPFDGVTKNSFNMYFEPRLDKSHKICTKDDLIGKWAVVLRGTEYPNLYFNVVDQILPGDEEKFTPVC